MTPLDSKKARSEKSAPARKGPPARAQFPKTTETITNRTLSLWRIGAQVDRSPRFCVCPTAQMYGFRVSDLSASGARVPVRRQDWRRRRRRRGHLAADETMEGRAVHAFAFQQLLRHQFQLVAVDGQNVFGFGVGPVEDQFHFLVDFARGFFAAIALEGAVLRHGRRRPGMRSAVRQPDG